jgi:hypothetical protein
LIRNTVLVLALVIAVFLSPLRGLPFANGPPLESIWDIFLIAILAGTLAFTYGHPVKQGRWTLLLFLAFCVVGAKTVVYQQQVPHGLVGQYSVEPAGKGPRWEKALHQSLTDATRIDGPLAFYNSAYRSGRLPFPFFFLNDKRRHPWVGGPPIVKPTVHAQWEGYLVVEQQGPISFRLDTPDECGLTLDERAIIPPGKGLEHCGKGALLELEAGFHRLEVTYAQYIADLNAPPPQSRLVLQWKVGEGHWETVPASVLFPYQLSLTALEKDRKMGRSSHWLFLMQLLLLAASLGAMIQAVPLQAWRGERGKLAFWALLFIGLALVMTLRDARNPSSSYIWLGFDPSDFESEARAYITESWFTVPSNGHEAKVVYTYFLAASHLVFGENLIQIIFLQRLLQATGAFLIYWIGKNAFSSRAGLYAMVLTAASTHMLGWSRALYPVTLAVVLLALTLICSFRAQRLSSPLWMLSAGVLMGLSIHTRPNFAPFVAVMLLWLAIVQRPWRRAMHLMGTFVAGVGLIEALARLRALATYGTFSVSQSMLQVNLHRGNPIPEGIDLSAMPDSLPFGLPKHLWAMGAYATQKPLAFAIAWLKKLLYLFGINFLNLHYNPKVFTYEIFFFSAGGLLGAVLARRLYSRSATLLPLSMAAVNGAVLVITNPMLHAFRLLVPLLPFLAIYVGVALESLDFSRPLKVSWLQNFIKAGLFFTLMPFRYGIQYAFIGIAYFWPDNKGVRPVSTILEEMFREPRGTSPLTPKPGPIQ